MKQVPCALELQVGYSVSCVPASQRNRLSATGSFREAQSHKPIWTIFLRENVLSNGELESKLRYPFVPEMGIIYFS